MIGKSKEYIQEKLHWIFGNIMGIISLILIVAVFGGTYFFVIAPNFISKPLIGPPFLPLDALSRIKAGETVINSSHINYVINELGAYKLNKPIFTKDYPVMKFIITDTGQIYYSYVNDHLPITAKGNPKAPDVLIKASQETVYDTIKSDNVPNSIKSELMNGTIQFNMTADMATLARKGYLSLYRVII